MKIYLKQIDKHSLVARGESNHWVTIDDKPDAGHGAGSSPMELMLMSIASCTAMDVISILKKRRAKLYDLEIEIDGERRDEHPRFYTDIHIKYLLRGKGLKVKDVERAINLSEEKYCSAIGMVKNTTNISSEYQITESAS